MLFTTVTNRFTPIGRTLVLLSWSVFFLLAFGCHTDSPQPTLTEADFADAENLGTFTDTQLNELSGLIASRTNSGLLWAHNDSGDTNRVFLVNAQAQRIGSYFVENTKNRDWEDITASIFSDGAYVYLADTGDNLQEYGSYAIYRFKEPAQSQLSNGGSIKNAETIRFKYPDGSHDAECLFIDHETKDLYIITKREANSKIYRLRYPQATTSTLTAEYMQELSFNFCTAGDISADNQEIILKNYAQVFYWKRRSGESVLDALKRAPKVLPYTVEPQGEALAFAVDNTGYYTTSEENPAVAIKPRLYFYRRK